MNERIKELEDERCSALLAEARKLFKTVTSVTLDVWNLSNTPGLDFELRLREEVSLVASRGRATFVGYGDTVGEAYRDLREDMRCADELARELREEQL